MMSAYLPTTDLHNAPPIVQQLREAFDNQLESLHKVAVRMQSTDQDHATKMLHVPFTFEQYDVEAMYDLEQDLFTQLVARPKNELDHQRPSYTISLFLVADPPEEDASTGILPTPTIQDMTTTEKPLPKKDINDHLSLGTSQNMAQAGDGTAIPLALNAKQADPSMRKDAEGKTASGTTGTHA